MASLINFSGLASGIDSNALITATEEATRKSRVDPQKTKISGLQDTNSAFTELKTKLDSLKTLLSDFTTLNGGGVSKLATSSRESVVTATADNGATTGSYSVTTNALAKNAVVSFNPRYSSSTSPLQSNLTGAESAANRTITVNIGTGADLETVAVQVTNGSYSVGDFVTAFNNASTKAEASLVNTGTAAVPQYAVVITSSNEGLDKGQVTLSYSGSTAITNWDTEYTIDQASNASVSIAGIGTITRPTNTISDILTGVTLNLVSTSASPTTVRVGADSTTTKAKIQAFVDSYNEIINYIKDNDTITRDESGTEVKNVFAPLASSSVDEGILSSLRDALAATSFPGGSAVSVLPDLGIATLRDGTLELRGKDFDSAIAAEPNSISELLRNMADRMATTGGTIDQFTRFNGTIDITLNGNTALITDLNTRITEAEAQITKSSDDMRARFARLESVIGKLQNQQKSLTAALSGLG